MIISELLGFLGDAKFYGSGQKSRAGFANR
jgi:hypothetical protein